MGATISAGLSLNWVRGIMNATWAELYASAGRPGQAHDPIFVPHLSGERTPYCDPALRGSWTGLALADDRTSVLRSALEGTAFAIRDALDALLGDDRPPRLRLAGGGTLAAGWRQLLADVLGVPLYAVDVPRPPAGAPPSSGPPPPACSALTTSPDRWRQPPAWRPSPTRPWPPFTRNATPGSGASSLLSKSPPSRPPSPQTPR